MLGEINIDIDLNGKQKLCEHNKKVSFYMWTGQRPEKGSTDNISLSFVY